jgi:Ni/Co efflux regulator RcnB
MKRQLEFVLLLALGAGTLGSTAAAQDAPETNRQSAQLESATFDPSQGAVLRQVDWDDHRRCDGDHDRDDRGCYDRDGYRNRDYRVYQYYGNGYYATPYYPPAAGWYDRDGRWHAYDRDRDHDRRHHDDDDRR